VAILLVSCHPGEVIQSCCGVAHQASAVLAERLEVRADLVARLPDEDEEEDGGEDEERGRCWSSGKS